MLTQRQLTGRAGTHLTHRAFKLEENCTLNFRRALNINQKATTALMTEIRHIWWKKMYAHCIFSRGRDVGLVGLVINATYSDRSFHSRSRANRAHTHLVCPVIAQCWSCITYFDHTHLALAVNKWTRPLMMVCSVTRTLKLRYKILRFSWLYTWHSFLYWVLHRRICDNTLFSPY